MLDLVADPDRANIALLATTLTDLGGCHPLDRMPGTPPYPELQRNALLVEIDAGVEARVCSLGHLRAMKRASTRPRDGVDLAELDELHGPG